MIDLLVAGAGPSGLATAIEAATAGLSVVVLDPRADPVDKACGEGLMPAAVDRLGALGVEVDGHPIRGIRYLDHRRSAFAPFRSGVGLGVRRTVLSSALHDRARACGVKIEHASVGVVAQDHLSVSIGDRRARYLVAADGLHSPIRRQFSLGRPDRRPARYGLRAHYAARPWSDEVEVHWSARTEAYLTPVAGRLVGVAILSDERRPYAELVAAFPALLERIGGAEMITAVRGAGPLRQRVRARVAGRVLLVGDAAGYVDALTGEGIALALAEARELVRCVVAGRPHEYEAAWRRVSRPYRMITETLLLARGPARLGPAIVPLVARLPRVFGSAVNALAG